MKLNYKQELIKEIVRDSRNPYDQEYLEGLEEYQLKEILQDLIFRKRFVEG